MRLPNIAPADLTLAQKPVYDTWKHLADTYLPGFVTSQPDGKLIGPFNAMVHFPKWGTPCAELFKSLAIDSRIPGPAREVAILVTGARTGSIYEMYSHETLAPTRGLDISKVRTIVAGSRPSDLTEIEGAAYDIAFVLNNGHQIPETTFKAGVELFGIEGVAEIVWNVGTYSLICAVLNAFDVNVPGTEMD